MTVRHPACLALLAAGLLALAGVPALAAESFDHGALDEIAKAAVKGRLVDYDAVQKRRPALKEYLARVAEADLKGRDESEKAAFYTNAYNALVLEAVLAHQRPKSVLKVPGFFDKKKHAVAGESLTLNELEEKKLRAKGDPRVHFVVNCASDDCPPLAPFAYTGAKWEQQLEQQTRAYLTRPREVVVDDEKKTIQVVQLFEWYAKDWGGEDGVRRSLARYRPKLKGKLLDKRYKLTYRPYDWDLNAVR